MYCLNKSGLERTCSLKYKVWVDSVRVHKWAGENYSLLLWKIKINCHKFVNFQKKAKICEKYLTKTAKQDDH